jgi:hypothetical protein
MLYRLWGIAQACRLYGWPEGLDYTRSPVFDQCCPENASHDTFAFQFTNVPVGLSFHAQTCNV